MPAFIKTKEDERLWQKAKDRAEEEGHKEDWGYVTGIYKRMHGGKVATNADLALDAAHAIFKDGTPPDGGQWHGGPAKIGINYSSPEILNRVEQNRPDGSVLLKGTVSFGTRPHSDGGIYTESFLIKRFLDVYPGREDALLGVFNETVHKDWPELEADIRKWLSGFVGHLMWDFVGYREAAEFEDVSLVQAGDIKLKTAFVNKWGGISLRQPFVVDVTLRAKKKAPVGVAPFAAMSDAQLDRLIARWESDAPENFWRDGELRMTRPAAYAMYRKQWRAMTPREQVNMIKSLGAEYKVAAERVASRLIPNAKFPEAVAGLIAAFKADPRYKIRMIRGDTLVVAAPGLGNPDVGTVVFTGLSKETATVRLVMKDGNAGWFWDAYRKPVGFLDKDTSLRMNIFAKDPTQHAKSFLATIEQVVKEAYTVYDKATNRLYSRAEWEALTKKREDEEAARKKQEEERAKAEEAYRNSPEALMDEIESFLKSMRYMKGRAESVDRYDDQFVVEPSNRKRLDHYVGSNYYPDDDDDPEGWDEEGWEEDYAGPMYREVKKKLDDQFGVGVCDVEIGEKGHVNVYVNKAKLKGAKMAGYQADSDGSYMSVGYLKALAEKSQELLQHIDNDTPLPDWVEAKIGQAANNINSVRDYFAYNPDRVAARRVASRFLKR